VGRAFSVLELVADRPLRASEIARGLGLSWATTHRVVSYLTEMGYLERDARTRHYSVGVRSYSVGSSYLARLPLHHVCQPYLEAAATIAAATAQLVERDHRRSVVLSVVEARQHHVPETTIGCNFPLHCGSKGHVLLAHADPAFVDDYLSRPLEVLTPWTIVDPEVLRERFAEVRAQGYAVTDRDTRLFSASVAAPIVSPADEVVASVTLVVHPTELHARRRQLIGVVQRTAEGISRLAGDARRRLPPR
jgi:DNA-binding IclR family transcriptional regulator